MRDHKIYRWLTVLLVLCLALSCGSALLLAKQAAKQNFAVIAAGAGGLARQDAAAAQIWLAALKASAATDRQAGEAWLQNYGYGPGYFYSRGGKTALGVGVVCGLLLFAGAGSVLLYHNRQKRRRIQQLTAYLEQINQGGSQLLAGKEDEFAFLEDELYKTVMELLQTRENAVRERQALADNLADIAHQLKTPLTAISLLTELLADNAKNEEDALYLQKLEQQRARLEKLVSVLLTLAKLDAGTLELERQPVLVPELLAAAAATLEPLIKAGGQQLELQQQPEVSYLGDAYWSAEACRNLLKNCLEHTPAGGEIKAVYSQNPIYTQIIIEDEGAGFEQQDLPYLFERFYKGQNAAKDSVGIGLALTQSVFAKQNGVISAENKPTGGARFIIKIYQA